MRSLRYRLIVVNIMMVMGCAAVISALLAYAFENTLVKHLAERLSSEAFLISDVVSDGFEAVDPISTMESYAEKLSSFTGARITIVADDGTVLGDSMESARTMVNHADRPEVIEAMSGRTGVSVRYSSTLNIDMMYVAVPARRNGEIKGVVRLAVPLTTIRNEKRAIWTRALQVTLMGVALSVVLIYFLSGSMVRPLKDMVAFANGISRGDLTRRVGSTGYEETSRLGAALNHMAEMLDRHLKEIEDANNVLQTVLGNMVSGVLAIDENGRVILANPAALRILNTSHDDLVNKHYIQGLRNYELSELISRVLKTKTAGRAEIHLIHPAEKIVEVSVQPVRGASGKQQRVIVVLYDITEMRNLARARTDFVANVSHELRTPVTSIKGFAETLLEADPRDVDTVKEFARIIRDEADRLSRLIADLLELSRIETMRAPLAVVPEDVCWIVEEAMASFRHQFAAAGLEVHSEMPEAAYALTNRDMTFQVMTNLLENALKYTPSGGHIWVRVKDAPDHVRVEVEDTGIGIPSTDLERIFERFYRVDKDRSRRTGGTGLGLSICKHIVESLNGRIGVESTLKKGSLFWFTLPKPSAR